jgi:hypothetical protein
MDTQDTTLDDINQKQIIWYGHVERMYPMWLPKIMINWKPAGKSKVVPEEPGNMIYIYIHP